MPSATGPSHRPVCSPGCARATGQDGPVTVTGGAGALVVVPVGAGDTTPVSALALACDPPLLLAVTATRSVCETSEPVSV